MPPGDERCARVRVDISDSKSEHSLPLIAVVGDNTIDRYFGSECADFVGGNAVNVAAQLGLAGERVAYFGAVGTDPEARLIVQGLADTHVDATRLVAMAGDTALTQIRLTDEGDRVFEREDFGVTAEYFPSASVIAEIAAAAWVHIGMLPRASELRKAVRAINPQAIISQDCAVSSGYEDLTVAFESVSGRKPGGAEARAVAAIFAGAHLAIVTRGALGALGHDGSIWWRQDAVAVEVLDTTGAGDSFIAGFIAGRVRGMPMPDAIAQAASWAAATCQHLAGYPQGGSR